MLPIPVRPDPHPSTLPLRQLHIRQFLRQRRPSAIAVVQALEVRGPYGPPNNDPGRTDRYQAEALIWKHLPVSAIQGICCSTEPVRDSVKERANQLGLALNIVKTASWYF